MKVEVVYNESLLELEVPDSSDIYESHYEAPSSSASGFLADALIEPVGSESMSASLKKRKGDRVVIALSDITRPIPYREFLPLLLDEIKAAGIDKGNITILIATGMHRPSTESERLNMFGREIMDEYAIVDHDAEGDLATLDGSSYSGGPVIINRLFAEADYKITIGLVEPHFMAGFSGGRKTVCPGLSCLETIKNFHGYDFLSNPLTGTAMLEGNPCHMEALSVAKLAGVDFSINVVLNNKRQVARIFAGDIVASHDKACAYVMDRACPQVLAEADVAVTGCGGYPLDATFYQCAKALVNALGCVKKGGTILAAGSCSEGPGSQSYKEMLRAYNNDYSRFINDIRSTGIVKKDQWQIQMQARFDEKVGWEHVHFYTHGLGKDESAFMGAKVILAGKEDVAARMQAEIDKLAARGLSFAVLPEGPYCAPRPIDKETSSGRGA